MTQRTSEEIKEEVREYYSARARQELGKREEQIPLTAVEPDSCCEPTCCGPSDAPTAETSTWADQLYSAEELGNLPEEASKLSLGCGNPTAIAELRSGEAVLDLGSGSGLDCFLSAQQVGPKGKAVGLDMNDDMLELAHRNLAKIGAANVEFHKGEMEAMPFPDATFNVIISNCVINLSPDKDAVFRESLRVLKPGGRLSVSDMVWKRPPTEAERADNEAWAGCVAGALHVDEYVSKLKGAGFSEVTVRLADEHVSDLEEAGHLEEKQRIEEEQGPIGVTSAYITATKAGAQAKPSRCC
jgi:ubiquinone/menaquinone biosynthesis C-methylase UbiE